MSKWSEFYKDRLNESYQKHIDTRYEVFIRTIADRIRWYNSMAIKPLVIELGCGIGSITKSLISTHNAHADHVLIDKDTEMLLLARKNLAAISNVSFRHGDIINKQGFKRHLIPTIVHSHGVLEHMQDDDIKTAVQNWPLQSQFHYVPSSKYKEQSFGDERLMDSETWKKLTDSKIVEFNDGYDYMIVR